MNMSRRTVILRGPTLGSLLGLGMLGLNLLSAATDLQVNGERAFAHARRVVAFGPRPSGSAESEQLRNYVQEQLAKAGLRAERQAFRARTPEGPVSMTNLIVKLPGTSGKRILVSGHYDTKRFRSQRFVGANDAGSSTALLLELVTVLKYAGLKDEVWIVFFDGEEAVGDWSESDSLYGSRHLAAELRKDGEISAIKALINLDMIGDRNLRLAAEYNSDQRLLRLAMRTAREQGHPDLFDDFPSAIEDDHIPFARLGVPTLNLIDFSYGPSHSYWHTERDTIDKLSAKSFEIVGNLVLGILKRLD